jgi:hypothetical protein
VAYASPVRPRALLGLSLPLAAAGCVGGHAAGYVLAGTSTEDAGVHGYLGYTPQFLGICFALVAVSVALRLAGRLRGRLAAWPFALLPPLAFLTQELVERLAARLPAHAVFEPPVYAGLAAQLPIAFLACFAARTLLRVADAAARALAPRPALAVRPRPLPFPAAASLVVRTPVALDRLSRAPPACRA